MGVDADSSTCLQYYWRAAEGVGSGVGSGIGVD